MTDLQDFANRQSKPPTVWHVGGDDVHMRIPLLLKLRERGFRVGAVGSADHVGFSENNIQFLHYPLSRSARPWADYWAQKQLVLLFQEHQPDVVHAFDTRPAILAPIAAKKVNVPGRIRTITGMGRLFSSTSPTTLALRNVYRAIQRRVSLSCVTVFQNCDDRQYYRSHGMTLEGRDALVPGSGIDVKELERSAASSTDAKEILRNRLGIRNKLVVTMVARLVWQKGVREFLKAAKWIGQERQDVAFLLVGPLGEAGARSISKAEIQRHAPRVQYLGARDDVPTILSTTDLFVLPSYYREGVPRSLLEAGALGIPLITTDMPGCRDVVQHGEEGLLIPPRDAEALAQAIRQLLYSQSLRDKMGRASRLRVQQQFSLDQVANAYAIVYRKALRAA